VVYFALRVHNHPLPAWFPCFGLSYILAAMLIVMVVSQRIHRNRRSEGQEAPKSAWRWIGRAWMAYLVAVWSGLFLLGAYLTLSGRLEWRRSVPAGAFLLVFIALFSWGLYKDLKRPGKPTASADGKTTNKS
jgi:uncharacterized membrane protein YfcA